MNTTLKLKINNILTKTIVGFLYLFAFGLFTSRALTSNCIDLICLLGIVQLIISKKNPITQIKDKTLNIPIILFTIALFASIIGNFYPETFSKAKGHLLFFLFFYIIVANLHNLKQVKKLLTVATISMIIAIIYGTYQHYFLNIDRIEGFLSPLSFGGYLAIFMIFLITYAILEGTKITYRLACFMGTVLVGANLLFTKARGAWLGFLGGVFTIAWLKNKKLLAHLLIFCLLMYFFLPQTYISRFQSIFDTKTNNSNLTRIALWKSALLMYRDHLINGVGLNRFEEEYTINYKQPLKIKNPCHAHNNVLQYMAETGTIGLISFIWLMASIISWLYKNYTQITNSKWRWVPLASLCSVIIFNLQGLTNVNYGGNNHGDARSFFWFLIALNMVIANLCKEESQQTQLEITSN